MDERQFVKSLREVCTAIIEQCAKAVDDIPVASLYQSSVEVAAVIDFKRRAIAEIRSLADPV